MKTKDYYTFYSLIMPLLITMTGRCLQLGAWLQMLMHSAFQVVNVCQVAWSSGMAPKDWYTGLSSLCTVH